MNVAVEGELRLVLEGGDGAGVPESPDLGVALRGNCSGGIHGESWIEKDKYDRNEPNFRTTPLLRKTGSLMVLCHDHQKRSYLVVCLQQKCFGFRFLLKPKL